MASVLVEARRQVEAEKIDAARIEYGELLGIADSPDLANLKKMARRLADVLATLKMTDADFEADRLAIRDIADCEARRIPQAQIDLAHDSTRAALQAVADAERALNDATRHRDATAAQWQGLKHRDDNARVQAAETLRRHPRVSGKWD